jgi:hypothetical protein
MSGLLRRLTRRRPATADETGTPEPASSDPAAPSAETPAQPGGDQPVAADEQATQVLPATGEQSATAGETASAAGDTAPGEQTVVLPAPMRDLPAGIDPADYADAPAPSASRAKLRRRLRYLRRVRELLLRDLGGFTFEIHRTAGGTLEDAHRRLAETKVGRIAALDTEVRALEERLGEPHEATVLREPGIGGTCPECGELHASDAHYCSRCGAPLDAKARARRDAAVAAAVQQTTGSHPTAEPASASVLWAAGPHPATKPEVEEAAEPRSEVTSQWLALPQHEKKDEEPAPEAESAPAAHEPAPEAEVAAAPDEPASEGDTTGGDKPGGEARGAEEPELEPAGEEPTFEPAPNGRRADDPEGDAVTSQKDKAS